MQENAPTNVFVTIPLLVMQQIFNVVSERERPDLCPARYLTGL